MGLGGGGADSSSAGGDTRGLEEGCMVSKFMVFNGIDPASSGLRYKGIGCAVIVEAPRSSYALSDGSVVVEMLE